MLLSYTSETFASSSPYRGRHVDFYLEVHVRRGSTASPRRTSTPPAAAVQRQLRKTTPAWSKLHDKHGRLHDSTLESNHHAAQQQQRSDCRQQHNNNQPNTIDVNDTILCCTIGQGGQFAHLSWFEGARHHPRRPKRDRLDLVRCVAIPDNQLSVLRSRRKTRRDNQNRKKGRLQYTNQNSSRQNQGGASGGQPLCVA